MPSVKQGVLLVNLGTPDDATAPAVRQFLKEFLSDKRVVDAPRLIWLPILYAIILTFRPRVVAKNYQKIWMSEGSPLMVFSRRQQTMLQAALDSNPEDTEYQVELAMTYRRPSIDSALTKLQEWGADNVLVLPLYPQFSYTTTACVDDRLESWKARGLPMTLVNNYHDHPAYIQALADSIRPSLTPGKRLVMSFHGIPQRFVDNGDPYQAQCIETAGLLASSLDLTADQWELAYQSRVGREEWLTPYFDQRMTQLAAEGHKDIVVVTPGFSVDCLETLEEVAMENKALFLENGGERFEYVAALNASPGHIEMMSQIVKDNLSNQPSSK